MSEDCSLDSELSWVSGPDSRQRSAVSLGVLPGRPKELLGFSTDWELGTGNQTGQEG